MVCKFSRLAPHNQIWCAYHRVETSSFPELGPNSSNVWTTRSTFSKNAFVDNRASLIVKVDSFLGCHKFRPWAQIPTRRRHGRNEIVPMDFQRSFDGVRLEFPIHIQDLFHDPCVFLR